MKKAARFRAAGGGVLLSAYFAIRYVLAPASFRVLSIVSPIFLVSWPEMKPRMLCSLCRCRHKAHYADVRIMPTCAGNPACVAGVATMESA